jgi:predicted nucleic acid-binding protein
MKVFFDTSVLVAAVVDQLAQHERAFSYFSAALEEGQVCACSPHVLAECYATLTALPLPRRVQPEEARLLIETNFVGKLTVVEMVTNDYREALRRVAGLGLRSGVVYDALHLGCAEKAGYERLVTFNAKDFERLKPKGLSVLVP